VTAPRAVADDDGGDSADPLVLGAWALLEPLHAASTRCANDPARKDATISG